MSFGAAASPVAGPCPCGSGDPFGTCCGPLLAGTPAPTPERLMRSRYTAFSLGDAGYLERTWHPRTRPHAVEPDPGLTWTGLEVLETGESGDEGVVEFRARWRQGRDHGTLHERSRFARRAGRWFYLDGEVSAE